MTYPDHGARREKALDDLNSAERGIRWALLVAQVTITDATVRPLVDTVAARRESFHAGIDEPDPREIRQAQTIAVETRDTVNELERATAVQFAAST